MAQPLLQFNDRGIYCAPGDFYIDPWKPVDFAVITHAHSDHARWGHHHYLAHHLSAAVLRYRLGSISLETAAYGQSIYRNGIQISFHPSGHIIGSAQVRVEYKGAVWVVSGDYKTEDDGLSTPFEPLKCHTFISECTFGLPIYKWPSASDVHDDINRWWERNAAEGRTSFIAGYSLGKTQRILKHLDSSIGNIFVHGTIDNTNKALQSDGVMLPAALRLAPDTPREHLQRAVVVCPPSALGSPWMRRNQPFSFGYCSGWMAVRGAKRRMAVDRGFVLSDHADWRGLIEAIKATDCECVCLTHGYTASFARYLNEVGLNAHEAHTSYGEEDDSPPSLPSAPLSLAREADPGPGAEDETPSPRKGGVQ